MYLLGPDCNIVTNPAVM